MFGIVKTSHKSKLGDVQQMSYQMVNAFDIDTMDGALQCTMDYIKELKSNKEVFFDYLKRNSNYSNDYEVLLALVNQDSDFYYSKYFKQRKDYIIRRYIQHCKMGKIINEGDNLTIFGSPYAMLMHTVGLNPEDDPTFKQEEDCIQCYTKRFKDGEYLAEMRNPFNGRMMLGCLHNHYDWRLEKYFHIGDKCIAVNMVHTDFQSRSNGSDQDSDQIYTTNQPDIVAHAKYCYTYYPTTVNNIPQEKDKYNNTIENFAKIDNKLAASQKDIGSSSNIAQIAQAYDYSFDDKIYLDSVYILAVLAQLAIDSGKRTYEVNIGSEIKRIKKELDVKNIGYPIFWKVIKGKNDKRNGAKIHNLTPEQKQKRDSMYNDSLICPMNYLYEKDFKIKVSRTKTISMKEFFIKFPMTESNRRCKKVERLIEKYSLKLNIYNQSQLDDNTEDYLLLREDFEQMIEDIKTTYISRNYLGLMSFLIDRALNITSGAKGWKDRRDSNINKNRSLLLKTLYTVNSEQFLRCFSKNLQKTGNGENENNIQRNKENNGNLG